MVHVPGQVWLLMSSWQVEQSWWLHWSDSQAVSHTVRHTEQDSRLVRLPLITDSELVKSYLSSVDISVSVIQYITLQQYLYSHLFCFISN